jgi:hypothetical protein
MIASLYQSGSSSVAEEAGVTAPIGAPLGVSVANLLSTEDN